MKNNEWYLEEYETKEGSTHRICDTFVDNIAFCSKKNGQLIVKSVNCHDKLLDALKSFSKCERGVHLPADVVIKMMEAIDEAEK